MWGGRGWRPSHGSAGSQVPGRAKDLRCCRTSRVLRGRPGTEPPENRFPTHPVCAFIGGLCEGPTAADPVPPPQLRFLLPWRPLLSSGARRPLWYEERTSVVGFVRGACGWCSLIDQPGLCSVPLVAQVSLTARFCRVLAEVTFLKSVPSATRFTDQLTSPENQQDHNCP